MTPFHFEPIGWLKSPFIDKFGTPRQGHLVPAAQARVEWAKGTQPENWLDGLEGFSHVWLISVFHQNYGKRAPNKIHPPRLNGRRVGVLSTRSPHRPNPIGLTLARIIEVEGRQLRLSEVDLIDGTPLLDIKPYIPEADHAKQASCGWVATNPWPQLAVHFSDESEASLDRLFRRARVPMPLDQFKLLIQQSLACDPRAVADRQDPPSEGGPRRWFWLKLYNLDIGFYFSPRGIEVGLARPEASKT